MPFQNIDATLAVKDAFTTILQKLPFLIMDEATQQEFEVLSLTVEVRNLIVEPPGVNGEAGSLIVAAPVLVCAPESLTDQ